MKEADELTLVVRSAIERAIEGNRRDPRGAASANTIALTVIEAILRDYEITQRTIPRNGRQKDRL